MAPLARQVFLCERADFCTKKGVFMGLRKVGAQAVSALSTVALKHVFRRPAANFPGKIALYVDPRIIADLQGKLRCGSIVVVGTNGKTTVSNLLADVVETAGHSVVCNRTGANLDSGVATALLHAQTSDWGVFESDELWLARSLPQLQANYVLLLNLFRDQLDRCGEIDRIQDSIVDALAASPRTVLVYNADDPLCATIAARAAKLPERASTPSVAFGVGEDMGLEQNTVADAQMCQWCSSMFEYRYRQYGQLGDYHCPNCGFERPALDFEAVSVQVGESGLSFTLRGPQRSEAEPAQERAVRGSFSGSYMVYNLMAVSVAATLLGCSADAVQQAIDRFDPNNGRLQSMTVNGRHTLLNLAKNPTGFNQNLKIVTGAAGPKAVAFFINDREADGRDISWLWDVDFEELAADPDIKVFAGGIRRNDMQLRLKYAGIKTELVEGAADVVGRIAGDPLERRLFFIANYTALPTVKSQLDAMADASSDQAQAALQNEAGETTDADASAGASPVSGEKNAAPGERTADSSADSSRGQDEHASADGVLRIAHLFPDLLNLYGDLGNVRVLQRRCAWRGIPVEVVDVRHGEDIDLNTVDIVFLGGGPDREQRLASAQLLRMRDDLRAFVESDGVLLAICGGYQILGSEWLLGDETVEGLGILDIVTRRGGTRRLIENIVLESPLATRPVVGYENHAGRTYLGEGVQPFGSVISKTGDGNNDDDKADGALYRNVIGTYLHGPLLGKNPEIADWLIARALERKAGKPVELSPLDDTVELAANKAMADRLVS